MPNYGKIIKGGLSALKPTAEADPLATAIAARMAGQLQGAGELLGLRGANLPAAYAGDQRSMGALTRILNEQETGLASPGRRKFVKQGAAMTARAAVPDAVGDVVGTTALKKAVKDAVVPEDYASLSDAVKAIEARVAAHNALAAQQAAARAEAGITNMIEGHQPVLKLLRPFSGRTYDTGMSDIYALAGKVLPRDLTAEQKIANAAAVSNTQKLIRERRKLFDMQQAGTLVEGSPEAARLEEIRNTLYDTYGKKPFSRPTVDALLSEKVKELPTTVVKTGWKDGAELRQKYLPGVGHYVYDPLDNNPWWIKAPDAPLHDDVLAHEFLNSIYKEVGD
jgi:hypothetical protein